MFYSFSFKSCTSLFSFSESDQVNSCTKKTWNTFFFFDIELMSLCSDLESFISVMDNVVFFFFGISTNQVWYVTANKVNIDSLEHQNITRFYNTRVPHCTFLFFSINIILWKTMLVWVPFGTLTPTAQSWDHSVWAFQLEAVILTVFCMENKITL